MRHTSHATISKLPFRNCGAVSCQAVESNIVGYQAKDILSFSPTAGSFVKVDGDEGIMFKDYVVNCNEDEESSTGWAYLADAFNTYTSVGLFDASYVYLPQWAAEAMSGELGYTVTKGWYNVTDEGFENNVSETVIPYGKGVIAKATGSGAKVTFSGAVKAQPTTTDIGQFTIAGNVSPKEIAIGELVVNCNEDEESSTGWAYLADAVNTYTSVGLFDKSYVYLPQWAAEAMSGELGYTVTKGWFDVTDEGFENNVSESKKFGAGEGFVAKATGSGATITVKSALAEEAK